MADALDDEFARFAAEMQNLEGEVAPAEGEQADPVQTAPPPSAPRPAAVVSGPAARASATIGSAPTPAAVAPPPMPPVPPPAPVPAMMPMPPVPPPPLAIPGYGMMPMYVMPPPMPPPPQFHMQPGIDPAVLAHMRQQMGAAAAANATAVINAQQAALVLHGGPAPKEVDVSKLHFREVAGEKWVDPSLAEWPENDFRIFVGNLGTEVNDDVITRAFNKYASFNKAKVVRDKVTKKSKGYGFASFSEQAEMYRVLKEMEGKYIGNRPCKLKKSTWDKREVEPSAEDLQAAAKRLKTNPAGGTKTPMDRRKHINLLRR